MSLFLNLDPEFLFEFNETKAPLSFRSVDLFAFWLVCFLTPINLFLLFVLINRMQRIDTDEVKKYVLKLMVVNVFFSLCLNLLTVFKTDFIVSHNEKNARVCAILLKFPGFFYVMSQWSIYMILLESEKTTRNGLMNILPSSGNSVLYLRYMIHTVVKFIVPMFAISCFIIMQGRLYFMEHSCGNLVPNWATAFMGISDTLLSAGLLYLFADPVVRISRTGAKQNEIVYNVLKQNLFWSFIMIATTAVTMLSLTFMLAKIERDDNPNLQWRQQFSWVLTNLDLFINTFAVLSIYPGAWLDDQSPRFLIRIFRMFRDSNENSNTINKISVTTKTTKTIRNAES